MHIIYICSLYESISTGPVCIDLKVYLTKDEDIVTTQLQNI